MSYTEELCEYAADARFEDLPASVVAHTKRLTLDALGVIVGAADSPPALAAIEYARRRGGVQEASVLGSSLRTDAETAALVNGTMAADLELDDVHPTSNLHASSVFVPAVLAVGEARRSSGREWIAALAVAYDVGCRISQALDDSKQYERGFHPTAVSGTFGAAAGAASLLGLDAEQVSEAIGLASCQAAGNLTWKTEQRHFAKSLQSGVSARNGVSAAQLISAGFHGPLDALDGRVNIFDTFSTGTNFAPLTEGLGQRYEIAATSYKLYPCCRGTHAPLDAFFELRGAHDIRANAIERITVRVPTTLAPIIDANELPTHNVQRILAVAALDGRLAVEQLAADRQADPLIGELARRVQLIADPKLEDAYPRHWSAVVTIVAGGETYESARIDPLGSPDLPVSDADISQKFREVAGPILSAASIEAIIQDVDRLDELESIDQLVTHFRRASAVPE